MLLQHFTRHITTLTDVARMHKSNKSTGRISRCEALLSPVTSVSSIFEERRSATIATTDQKLLIWAMVVDYRMLPQMQKLIGQLVVVIAVV
jgi:hypothetical protein